MGKFVSTHTYCLSQQPDELQAWANDKAVKLNNILGETCPIFCYSGSSGVSLATVLAMVYYNLFGANFGMIYVRKPEEKTHGNPVEHSLACIAPRLGLSSILVFVDDTTSSGITRNRTILASRGLMKELTKAGGAGPVEITQMYQVLATGPDKIEWNDRGQYGGSVCRSNS